MGAKLKTSIVNEAFLKTKGDEPDHAVPVSTESDEAETEESEEIASEHVTIIEVTSTQGKHPVGIDVDLKVGVRCSQGCDLRGSTILLGDTEDNVLAERILVNYSEEKGLNTTTYFTVKAPEEPGFYTWPVYFFPLKDDTAEEELPRDSNNEIEADEGGTADSVYVAIGDREAEALESNCTIDEPEDIADSDKALVAGGEIGESEPDEPAIDQATTVLHEVTQGEYRFQTVAHFVRISMWRDSKAPVPVGEEYLLNISIKCIIGCSLVGQKLNILQNDVPAPISTIEMPEPLSDGTHHMQVSLIAPDKVGMFGLECSFEDEVLRHLHDLSTHKYFLTTNKKPQCRLNLSAVTKEDGSPVDYVYFHIQPDPGFPAKERSEIDGKVSFDVPWGEIRIDVMHDEYRARSQYITIPEGSETFDFTVQMHYQPVIFGKE